MAYTGTNQDAETERDAVAEALTAANQRLTEATAARATVISDLQRAAATDPQVTITAKDRILHDAPDKLASNATTLASDLTLRAQQIDGILNEINADQDIITTDLTHLVSDALTRLKNAERHSQLPDAVGTWANKKFLRITFDDPTDADLRARVSNTIEDKVAEGVKPEGMALLKAAVHAAAAPRGFKVRVLKPSTDLNPIHEDITRLGRWSGGEKLTVCVALYCTLAALRSANQGRRGQGGGTLLLDNPIGRASHGTLIRLQRDVAASHHVQLIYTTGVKDPDAVSQFPNVIRLDNRPGTTHNRRYIVQDTTTGHVNGVRVAHTDNPAPTTDGRNRP